MHVAVTGATGFLGRYIVNRLTANGHICRCWHRPTSDTGGFTHPDEIEWRPGTLDDPDAAATLVEGVDAVVHAALERPGDSDLVDFAQTNIVGSLRLIQAAKRAGARRFVFISTCAVHELILDDRRLDEAHPLWPTSHYGAHKAAIEKFIHSLGFGEGWTICALRPTGIYGLARPAPRSKWFDLVGRAARGEAIETKRGGKEVHADDVAAAVELLLHAPPDDIAGQAFNCYDRYISDADVARLAAELAGSNPTITDHNRGPKHQIDTSKLRALGMTFGGEQRIRDTITQLLDAAQHAPHPA